MKNILLIGLGRFGKHIAIQSSQLGHEIMAVDLDEERVNDALPYVTNAQIGDSTNEEFLKSLGIANYDICFVTIGGNFQNSLETTCLLKELGGKMVISRAERDVQEKFLLRNGADKVVYPEKMVAKWATIRYTDDHILDYMEVDASHAIFEVEVPKEWIGKTVGKLDIRKKYDINIMAVKDDGKVNEKITQIDELMLKTSGVVVEQTKIEVGNMGKMIQIMFDEVKNVYRSPQFLTDEKVKELRKIEDDLDLYQKEITDANFVILNNKDINDSLRRDIRNNLIVSDVMKKR